MIFLLHLAAQRREILVCRAAVFRYVIQYKCGSVGMQGKNGGLRDVICFRRQNLVNKKFTNHLLLFLL